MQKKKQQQPFVKFSLIAILFLLTSGTIISWLLAGLLVAPKPRTMPHPPSDLPVQEISLTAESGNVIAGWHIAAKENRGVIILLHPIRGSRRSMLQRARMLYAAGYAIVMIDLQAHGESSGEIITLGYKKKFDVQAAVDFAREQHPDEKIGVIGVSLGGAAALLASPLAIDALVLESVYSTIENAVTNRVAARLGFLAKIPAQLLLMQLEPRLGIEPEQLHPIDKIPKVDCPVLIISGLEDQHTTAAETRKMFEAARQPKQLWRIPGAAHVDLFQFAGKQYEHHVLEFFVKHMR